MLPSLPAAFCSRMQKLLGEDGFSAYLKTYESEAQRGLRVNLYKYTKEQLLSAVDFPLRQIPYEENGFYLDCEETGTGNHPLHHAGAFYLQEPAAMLPCAAAAPYIRPGDYVLDVCAAPGGKCTQLAASIGADGLIVANEFIPSRAKILLSNLERLGIPNAVVTNTDAHHLRTWYEGCFDCVLVDAPCSGEGMFRKNPLAISEWSEENVAMCAERSFEILSDAQACLRPGGILIYATCTFSPEENEETVARFLTAFPDFTIVPLSAAARSMTKPGLAISSCKEDLTLSGRCYPHIAGGEGQFVCILKKQGNKVRSPISSVWEKLSKQEAAAVNRFLTDLWHPDEAVPEIRKRNGQFYLVPAQLGFSGSCLACGVKLGEWNGSRIKPHHQLFSAYGRRMRRRWNVSSQDIRAVKYLHGETVMISDADCSSDSDTSDGYGCFCIDGCPLGGAKRVGNTLKNHYPKGLRIQGI